VVGGLGWWPAVESGANDWGVELLVLAGKGDMTGEVDSILFDPEGETELGGCRKRIPE
jgi:hypothetical protein